MMKGNQLALLLLALLLCLLAPAQAQDGTDPAEGGGEGETPAEEGSEAAPADGMPVIPDISEIETSQSADFVPTNFQFRIAVVGDYASELNTTTGVQEQVKTPLFLLDPSTGGAELYARNFPAKIIDSSNNGNWVIGIAPSFAVEGSSGNKDRECSVSLNLVDDSIQLIKEFPRFSNFQALFQPGENDTIYFSINEPAAENKIIRYKLDSKEEQTVQVEGNRFYLYGYKQSEPRGLWVGDPMSVKHHPVLMLLDPEKGTILRRVEFPGAAEVISSPDGNTLLAIVNRAAEASIGYYDAVSMTFHQVPDLVLTRPTIKWLNGSRRVVAKESTSTKDRLLLIDISTNSVQEMFSGYFKMAHWDIAPSDEAVVFVTDTENSPYVFVVPIDQAATVINRIPLPGVSNVSWVGCINPPSRGGGSWLDKLLPF